MWNNATGNRDATFTENMMTGFNLWQSFALGFGLNKLKISFKSGNKPKLSRARLDHIVKYPLFAFTGLGVAMLSSVLKSQMAIEINRRIMRIFVQMRSSLTHASQYSAEFAAM